MKILKRSSYFLAAAAAFLCLLSANSQAMNLVSQDEALKQMLPNADKIVSEAKALTPDQIETLKQQLGGSLMVKEPPKGTKETTDYTFYFGMKDGKKTGVAVMEAQPGKWGMVKMIIAMDPTDGKVKNLEVMSFSEKRGRPVARKHFLNQFIGKGIGDPLEIHKDIRAVTGATVSSRAVCFAVRKMVKVYTELYLKK
jgi:Na+-translocating ferredoxin:NAD+ oxidoreductase RnfG subunit